MFAAAFADAVTAVGELGQRVFDNAQLGGVVLGRFVDQFIQGAQAGVVGRRGFDFAGRGRAPPPAKD